MPGHDGGGMSTLYIEDLDSVLKFIFGELSLGWICVGVCDGECIW